MQPDYYKILGISDNASVDDIKQAYRDKAKQYHPDINKNPDAKLLFQLLNEAYRVLINPEKKRWYDFKLKYPSTTGMGHQTERRRTAKYESYYRAYTNSQQENKEEKEFEKYKKTILDNFLFYFLIVSGIMAIVFSAFDLIYDEVSMKNMTGMVFVVWFLILMFWGWNLMSKK